MIFINNPERLILTNLSRSTFWSVIFSHTLFIHGRAKLVYAIDVAIWAKLLKWYTKPNGRIRVRPLTTIGKTLSNTFFCR